MKSIKAIVILGVILAVLDAAVILVLNIADVIPQDEYIDLLFKSLSIIGIITLACLIIALIMNAISNKPQQ